MSDSNSVTRAASKIAKPQQPRACPADAPMHLSLQASAGGDSNSQQIGLASDGTG